MFAPNGYCLFVHISSTSYFCLCVSSIKLVPINVIHWILLVNKIMLFLALLLNFMASFSLGVVGGAVDSWSVRLSPDRAVQV